MNAKPQVYLLKPVLSDASVANLATTRHKHYHFSMRTTLNISLPEDMREWVDQQVKGGGYATVSEFFRELVREERRRQVRAEVETKLLQAVNSGESTPITLEFFDELRKKARERVARKGPAQP